jgi:phosphatidate cytidylyltransferase
VTTRIITGIVLAVLAIVIVYHGGLIFFLVMAALALLGLNEFYRLTRMYRPLPLAGLLGVALMVSMAWFFSPFAVFGAACAGLLFIALLGLAAGPKPGVTVRMSVTLLGMLYIGLGFSAVVLMRPMGDHGLILLTVVFGTWAGDTMAYFTGRFFGATPMAPVLSPKKTWEGFAGGAISAVIVVMFLGLYWEPRHLAGSLLLGVVVAVAAPLGDLFESLVKRDVQIKDSGRGIPGHGGVLDRFDALIFASVASYFLLTLVLGF